MDNAPILALDVLDDATLRSAINEQQRLIASNPAMEQYVGPALQQHLAERDRRTELDNAVLAELTINVPGDDVCGLLDKCVREGEGVGEAEACGRSGRVRTQVARFGAASPRIYPSLTTEEKLQARSNQIMRTQMAQNEVSIRATAVEYSCPLLHAQLEASGHVNDNSRKFILSAQMKRVAVANDGHRYDFSAIRAYISKNADARGMVNSPVTKQHMSGVVHYMAKRVDRKNRVKWVAKQWSPDMECATTTALVTVT